MSRAVAITLMVLIFNGIFLVTPVFAYSNGKFGATPFSDVMSAAGTNYSGSGLTKNALAAMMLSVTWPETAGSTITNTPSPMTLSRGDYASANLWADAQKNTTYKYVRAHWNPGAGVFQIDSAGLGLPIGLKEAIYTDTAAPIVASQIATTYKNASGTSAQRRALAWGSWAACNTGKCETIFNTIYNSTADTLYMTTDSAVSRSGGLATKTCSFTPYPATSFTCYKYDVNAAEGYTGSFKYTPYEGALGTKNAEPVPLPFITYTAVTSTGNTEYRYWRKEDTGYDVTIYKYRDYNTNARSNSNWFYESRTFNAS